MERLDKALMTRGLVQSRSQAEGYVKMGVVFVNGNKVKKPAHPVFAQDLLEIKSEQYVSRAALKLASAVQKIPVDFTGKVVLDVGSSTGGFTDYALQHGAKKVIAVDVGTDQLHPSLHGDKRIELHEKTDIRDFASKNGLSRRAEIDIVVADVSFVSLRQILPSVALLATPQTRLLIMMKPQFEAGKEQINKGVIKNSTIRRSIIKDFEHWLSQNKFIILDKADSDVAGAKGNVERFYLLRTK
jgi:23S rRNA (cytidine1920-2'-O)/16S rRNA (cytidine1409-2'-O)-methyltransferase